MPIFQSLSFWLVIYGAVAALVLLSRPAFARLAAWCGFADWFTATSFRWWVAVLWPAFLVGLAISAFIGLILFTCASFPSRQGDEGDEEAQLSDTGDVDLDGADSGANSGVDSVTS